MPKVKIIKNKFKLCKYLYILEEILKTDKDDNSLS